MAVFIFSNFANSTLAGGINNTVTSLTVQSGAGALFPNPAAGQQFVCLLTDAATRSLHEVIYVTARTADVFTIVRAQEGTTGLSWLANDIIACANTAGQMADLSQKSDPSIPLAYTNVAVYTNVGGTQYVSVNGATPVTTGASIFPPPPTGQAWVKLWSGAGGGGGAVNTANSSGGGPGGYAEGILTRLVSNTSVVIGAGGAAGSAAGGNGGSGGASSFGALAATGGGPGIGSTGGPASGEGAPGVGSGGFINLTGLTGAGVTLLSTIGGAGGNAPGGGGQGGNAGGGGVAAQGGAVPGGGGAGNVASGTGYAGGPGASGMAIAYY